MNGVAPNVVKEVADARDMWGAEDGAGTTTNSPELKPSVRRRGIKEREKGMGGDPEQQKSDVVTRRPSRIVVGR